MLISCCVLCWIAAPCLAARLNPMQDLQGLQSEGVIRPDLASQAGYVFSDRVTGNLKFALKSEGPAPGEGRGPLVVAGTAMFPSLRDLTYVPG